MLDVFENKCKLAWKPPEDDGGEPIAYYEVEKFDEEIGKWITCAKVKDTQAHVDDLQKGHSYQFRVKAVNHEGASNPLSTKDSTLAKNPYGMIFKGLCIRCRDSRFESAKDFITQNFKLLP